MSNHILIVDDEKAICQSLQGIFGDEGYRSVSAHSGETALTAAAEDPPDVVFLDIWLPGMDGLETLRRLKQNHPALPVIMISGHATIETAVRATRLGAFDFIEKPLDMDKILLATRNAIEFGRMAAENRLLRDKARGPEITGQSPAIAQIKAAIEKVGPTESWVLITGENGTGKELVAGAIHRLSARAEGPFVDVNCAAIPEELIESELFGHEKGAFTGAVAAKRGKFDLAHRGSLFLDEIADMSLKTQAKILRILQEQRFERVGGVRTNVVDVRVLAATNKDLTAEIAAGRFREDLYYRLNVIPIHVPPLRQRPEDIPLLAEVFLRQAAARLHCEPKPVDPRAMEILQRQPWPGNVRELKNLVERLMILSSGPNITPEDLPAEMTGQQAAPPGLPAEIFAADYKDARQAFERLYLEHKLEQFNGNISQTAEAVGLERSHLHKKLKTLGLRAGKADE